MEAECLDKYWLSKIDFRIPPELYQIEDRRIMLGQRFEMLKQLTNTRASIVVTFPYNE
jgi:hypothetical protein